MGRSKNRQMQFKQFVVRDDKCAMKIGTDAVILGVIADHPKPKMIADVGTGSGIVSLMLAQRFNNACITAIELNDEAYLQACDNFVNSPFKDRIECVNSSFQNWSLSSNNKYDLIVSNPPFFDGTSKSPFESRNMARHEDYLNLEELFEGCSNVLNAEGVVVVVWPVERKKKLIEAAWNAGFHSNSITSIKATDNHTPTRIIVSLSHEQSLQQEKVITLENGVGDDRKFTPEYLALMNDFFLKA